MTIRYHHLLSFSLLASVFLISCSETRQLAVDYPTSENNYQPSNQLTKIHEFQPLTGYSTIDGDDYYVRLISEFDFKGDNFLKSGCSSITPDVSKNDLTSALIFNVQNNSLKFKNEAVGYSYQARTGKCNFKFDAKKQNLTPWMRLDSGKETEVDYSLYSSTNSDVDVVGLVNKATLASSFLAFTGVGMGVAVIGQVASQWLNNKQQAQTSTPAPSANYSTETHTIPTIIKFTDKRGSINETVFKVHAVVEGGTHLLGANTKPLGELKIYPELTSSLLLKTKADGIPDARDLSFVEMSQSPIKSATGDINLQQLIEQSKHQEKPNLKPDWPNYEDVQSNCRKLKIVLKDLGFNKFDRNAYLYYFLKSSPDWNNYNISSLKVQNDNISATTLQKYRARNFDSCLNTDDYIVMKSMGLSVNTESEWVQMGDSSLKKEQFFTPIKAIERQLLAVIHNPNTSEMESQIYPLLNTASNGNGTVLLQNHLGDFGLEKLLETSNKIESPSAVNNAVKQATPIPQPQIAAPTIPASPIVIPGAGLIITAHQLIQVFSSLQFNELSCARVIPEQLGKTSATIGVILFTTKTESPRAKGGAMEFEFSDGKINRIAFQSPSYRDFEQDVINQPERGGCQINSEFLTKLH